jgi:hypothetical protein
VRSTVLVLVICSVSWSAARVAQSDVVLPRVEWVSRVGGERAWVSAGLTTTEQQQIRRQVEALARAFSVVARATATATLAVMATTATWFL